MTTCNAQRKDGSPCTARALPNRPTCFAHDPDLAERRQAAYAEGGRNKSTVHRLAKRTPPTIQGVLTTLFDTLDGLKDGSIEARTGTAMATVASAIARIQEVGVLQVQLDALEARAEKRTG